ncbi:MAG TPA: hypothetical protein VGI30_11680 [Caulobacteraceae bacterium]|jgi:hypothetical protein
MKLAIAAAFAAFSLAGTALADTRVVATLDKPQATNASFIAAGAVWNCAGTTCIASVAPDDSAGVSGCQELAHKIGPVTAYAGEAKALDGKGLERCNKAARSPSPIGTASR